MTGLRALRVPNLGEANSGYWVFQTTNYGERATKRLAGKTSSGNFIIMIIIILLLLLLSLLIILLLLLLLFTLLTVH